MNHQTFQTAPKPIDIAAKLNDQWMVANRFLVEEHGMPQCYYCKKPVNKEGDTIDPFWPQDDMWSFHKKCVPKKGERNG